MIPIVVTAYQEMAEIRLAMRVGAYDYILKDDLCDELVLPVLAGIGSRRRLEHEVRELRARRPDAEPIADAAGRRLAGPWSVLRETIRRAALSDRPVLVTGPTGAGKELVVGALHTLGPHPDEPLLDLNCSAIPEALMESQLFGHRKGAFTGADQHQQGYLDAGAAGDAVPRRGRGAAARRCSPSCCACSRPAAFGPSARRPKRASRGGWSRRPAPISRSGCGPGAFREDLYYRLNVLTIRVPPLADRREDIPALVAHFCRGQTRPLRFSAGGARGADARVLARSRAPAPEPGRPRWRSSPTTIW